METMKRIKIIFAAIVCAAALISCSKEMDQKRENTGGEIKTLSFGIDQSTKSTLTLGADGAMKMGWNAGDRIFVAKGEKVYIYINSHQQAAMERESLPQRGKGFRI